MQKAIEFLIGPLIQWLPAVFPWFMAALIIWTFFLRERGVSAPKFSYKGLAYFAAAYHAFYAALWSIGTYFYWTSISKESETAAKFYKVLLGWDYFAQHIWLSYWLNAVLAVIVALAFYAFLRLLGHKNDRFFDEGEEELGLACALVVGWPNFVLFIPVVFLSVVLISIFRMLLMKQEYTRLGPPFILALLLSIALGQLLIKVLGLSVLII